MPRPSRNLDRALLAAGRALLPATGCAGLTIRQVTEAAGVNPGMFHYHFKTREAFLRAVLQETYEGMFREFSVEAAQSLVAAPPGEDFAVTHLRAGLRVLARFVRDHRLLIGRVWADALCGDAVARAFLRDNIPRHGQVLVALLAAGQQAGALEDLPPPQALATCAGAVLAPLVFGGAMAASGELPKALARQVERDVLSDAAIDERIDLALRALAAPPGAAKRPTPKRRTSRKVRP